MRTMSEYFLQSGSRLLDTELPQHNGRSSYGTVGNGKLLQVAMAR